MAAPKSTFLLNVGHRLINMHMRRIVKSCACSWRSDEFIHRTVRFQPIDEMQGCVAKSIDFVSQNFGSPSTLEVVDAISILTQWLEYIYLILRHRMQIESLDWSNIPKEDKELLASLSTPYGDYLIQYYSSYAVMSLGTKDVEYLEAERSRRYAELDKPKDQLVAVKEALMEHLRAFDSSEYALREALKASSKKGIWEV